MCYLKMEHFFLTSLATFRFVSSTRRKLGQFFYCFSFCNFLWLCCFSFFAITRQQLCQLFSTLHIHTEIFFTTTCRSFCLKPKLHNDFENGGAVYSPFCGDCFALVPFQSLPSTGEYIFMLLCRALNSIKWMVTLLM